jgi:recombination protein RecA
MVLVKNPGSGKISLNHRPQSFDMAGLSGRVVEFSSWHQPACVSLSALFILECQKLKRGRAWIVPGNSADASVFYPPDIISAGIDCSSLPILKAESAVDGFGLTERLLRSGGFGIVVLDLYAEKNQKRYSLGRLHNIAQRHDGLVLCLTRSQPGHPSLDPMVFVHVHVSVQSIGRNRNRLSAVIQKDKTGSPGKCLEWIYESPPGLC